jgi:hypothetical protein
MAKGMGVPAAARELKTLVLRCPADAGPGDTLELAGPASGEEVRGSA